jgi:[acyl-carrier-protein] S-malonyltransferase
MSNDIAFLYPGQGSQHVGMGFDLYQIYPEVREIFDRADHFLDFPLSKLCFEGPKEILNQDLNAQLAVYTVSCIITEVLKGQDVFPDVVSGYSSGFYAAAYAAGCLEFTDGLCLVRQAGKILLDEGQKIDGSMAVIFGLPPEKVDNICQQAGHVQVSILNTPRQTIISGNGASVRKAMDLSLQEGALDVYPLSVGSAYHSKFIRQSGFRFLREIKNINLRDPQIRIMSYLSLDSVPKSELRSIMAAQLSRPVLWVDLIKRLRSNNTRLFIEVGPGKVISRTVRWIDREIEMMNTANEASLVATVERYRRVTESNQSLQNNLKSSDLKE